MTTIIKALIFIIFFTHNAAAEDFYPVASGSANEIKIAKMLEKKLNINANLSVDKDDSDSIKVVTVFDEDESSSLPRITVFIDTSVAKKESNTDKASAQVISIYSIVDISLSADRLQVLEWINTWNGNAIPIRLQVTNNTIVASTHLIATQKNPVSEGRLLAAYLNLVKAWPPILEGLRADGVLLAGTY